jgi:hypothetical protein
MFDPMVARIFEPDAADHMLIQAARHWSTHAILGGMSLMICPTHRRQEARNIARR